MMLLLFCMDSQLHLFLLLLQTDLSDVKAFAASQGFSEDPLWWDVAFWAERLREDKYDLKDEELRPYFALPAVLDGLFKVLVTAKYLLWDIRTLSAGHTCIAGKASCALLLGRSEYAMRLTSMLVICT